MQGALKEQQITIQPADKKNSSQSVIIAYGAHSFYPCQLLVSGLTAILLCLQWSVGLSKQNCQTIGKPGRSQRYTLVDNLCSMRFLGISSKREKAYFFIAISKWNYLTDFQT